MPRKTASWSRRRSASVKSRPQRLFMRNEAPSRSTNSDLGVERSARQTVLGDPVTQHAAGERVRVEERAGVTPLEQVEGDASAPRGPRPRSPRVCRSVRPAWGRAAFRSAGSGRRRSGEARRSPAPRGRSPAAAALLAEARAHPPERPGEREPLVDAFHGAVVLAARDLVDEPRHVETRRTAGGTGSRALPGVVREQELERRAPRGADVVALRDDDHPVFGRQRARWRKRLLPLDLDAAQEAGRDRLEALDVAQASGSRRRDAAPPRARWFPPRPRPAGRRS